MLRRYVLALFILFFAALSLLILRSVAPNLLVRQFLFFGGGVAIFWLTSRIPFHWWERYSPYLYGGLLFFLVFTHLFGRITRGTTSWIPIGSFHIQPSQVAVAITGMFICSRLAKKPIRNWRSYLEFLLIVGAPALLIFLEPDLGTTAIYAVSLASVFFLAKTRVSYILGSLAVAVIVVVLSWFFLLHPYQKDRITSFLNPAAGTSNTSYNAIQSVIAVGSGQFYGRGLGQGVQSHLRFLPERQTDFVFASLAEELGFIGGSLIILFYAGFALFIFWTGVQTDSLSAKYFCFITATMITVQTGVNIGMNMGLLPITGITLPLISYGGSSILSFCFQFGLIQTVVRARKPKVTLHIA